MKSQFINDFVSFGILTWCGDGADLPSDVEKDEDLATGDDMIGRPFQRVLAALISIDCDGHQLLP